jgi:hypothetical protein
MSGKDDGKQKNEKQAKQQYPPATAANGATVQAVAKALLRPLKKLHTPKTAT